MAKTRKVRHAVKQAVDLVADIAAESKALTKIGEEIVALDSEYTSRDHAMQKRVQALAKKGILQPNTAYYTPNGILAVYLGSNPGQYRVSVLALGDDSALPKSFTEPHIYEEDEEDTKVEQGESLESLTHNSSDQFPADDGGSPGTVDTPA